MNDHHNNPLLLRVLTFLTPDVFSHPVWRYFFDSHPQKSEHLTPIFYQTAEQFKRSGDSLDACKMQLLCGAYLNRLGEHEQALDCTSETRTIAGKNSLYQANLWAQWGETAIYTRWGNYEGAIESLTRLLNMQGIKGDWVLSNILALIHDGLARINTSLETSAGKNIATSEFVKGEGFGVGWLLRWGESPVSILSELPDPTSRGMYPGTAPAPKERGSVLKKLFSSPLKTLSLFFKGEFHLQWGLREEYPPKPPVEVYEQPEIFAYGAYRDAESFVPPKVLTSSSSDHQPYPQTISSKPPHKADTPPSDSPPEKPHLKADPTKRSDTASGDGEGKPYLAVFCLGPFRVYLDEHPVVDWNSSKGKSVFKYLLTHREGPIPKEVLMELFWPDTTPEGSRNNLNVAIYSLRQAFHQINQDFSHILYQDGSYQINPKMQIWVDYEAYRERIAQAKTLEQRGNLMHAIEAYAAAEALYQGDLLEEDRYEDWLIPLRRGLREDYLSLLNRLSHYYFNESDYGACKTMCHKILAVDSCREEAHRQLMRCFTCLGQPYLALRQYHLCEERLKEELDFSPSKKTTALYQRIRKTKGI